jgi:alpha-tubulin suppressor-like RCC1 family protein
MGGAHLRRDLPRQSGLLLGLNVYGELGDRTTAGRLTPIAVAGGLYFSQVSAGGWHTCGKTSAGLAYCWGWKLSGELGDATTTNRLTPTAVIGPYDPATSMGK